MPWLLTGDVSLFSEGNYHQMHKWMKLSTFTSLTRVCTSFLSFRLDSLQVETELLIYPKPDSRTVKHSEKTTQLGQKLSAGHPTQIPTSDDMGRPALPQTTRERDPSLNGLPSRPTGASGRHRRVPEEDDGGEGSTEHHAKLVAPGAPSGKEIARLEDGRFIELERQLSETPVAKSERDRRIAQLSDQLVLKSALLEQATAKAAEEKKRAGLELRELRAKLDELLLSRDQALEQAQSALQKAKLRAAEANERSQPACDHETELAEVRAELEAVRLRLTDAEDGWAKSKAEADTYRNQTPTGLVNTDADRAVHRLMERVRAMEAEMASKRWNEKVFEMMECRNEG
jgi:hypothetical protein